MAFAEDHSAYLADFGVTATIGGASVRGIFDEASADSFGGLLEGGKPTFICRSADVEAVVRGAELTVNSTAYIVAAAPRSDGTGMTVLSLEINQ